MKPSIIWLALLVTGIAGPAQAQKIYKCKNDKGEIFYTQAYDPVRCAGGGAQLNAEGVAVRHFDRVKTAEEITADKVVAEAKAEAERITAAQLREDQVLMMSYASEGDIKRAHEQQLTAIETWVNTAKMQLESQQRSLSDLLSTAAESERAKKPVPEAVAKNIATVRRQIEQQNATIVTKELEKKQSATAFEAKLARYRELVAKQMLGR